MDPLLFPSAFGSPGLIWDRSFIRSRRTISHISVLSWPLAKSVIPVLLVHTMCPDAVVISFTNQFLDRGANHTSVGSDGAIILFTQFPIWKDLFINVWWLRNVLHGKLKPTGPFPHATAVVNHTNCLQCLIHCNYSIDTLLGLLALQEPGNF